MKAIALFSGGLDSILAVKLIQQEGIEVEGIRFLSVFFQTKSQRKENIFSEHILKIKVASVDISAELFKIMRNPKYGYGKNINPCIDCHAFMIKKAGEYMKQNNGDFIITGEVLGERPMSQTKIALRTVEKASGMQGLVLRPLSAKLLEPTLPEIKGWVNRKNLMSIEGRSRKAQISLAEKYEIKNYPNPGGGCLLTEPVYAAKIRDLKANNPDYGLDDVAILRFGRHFRLTGKTKLIVGRDRKDNRELVKIFRKTETLLYPIGTKGPFSILRGETDAYILKQAASIVARYCDSNSKKVKISFMNFQRTKKDFIVIEPMDKKEVDKFKI